MGTSERRRLRVAIVGLGVGAAHADGFRRLPDQFEVVAVADLDPERADGIASWLGCEAVSGGDALTTLCSRDDLDVISLATPPALHLPQIEQVLTAGVDVICEKPLVGSLADVERLRSLEADTGQRVMPIYQYRFGRGLQRLRYLIDEGIAGRAYTATVDLAWRRRPEYYAVPWRGVRASELGGVLLGHALHATDMVTYVLGPVARVFARTSTRVNPIETEDCASVSLEMADGSLVSMSATLGSPEEITRHRFCFERLSAESGVSPYENHRDPWVFTGDDEGAEADIAAAMQRFTPQAELYKGQFARYHDAVVGGSELPVTLDDARQGLELVTAMYLSSATHADVELPIPPDHPAYTDWYA